MQICPTKERKIVGDSQEIFPFLLTATRTHTHTYPRYIPHIQITIKFPQISAAHKYVKALKNACAFSFVWCVCLCGTEKHSKFSCRNKFCFIWNGKLCVHGRVCTSAKYWNVFHLIQKFFFRMYSRPEVTFDDTTWVRVNID